MADAQREHGDVSRPRLHRMRISVTLAVATVIASAAFVAGGSHGLAVTTAPKISSFTPVSGPPGTTVTVLGSNFTGATTVAFNAVSSVFTVNSATQITATVPSAASTGPISVITPGGTGISSSNFTVTALPRALSLNPNTGPPGSTITVTGSNFVASSTVDVYFDTTDEVLVSAGASGSFTISISAPRSAVPGTHWVTGVERGTTLSAQAPFTVQTNWSQFRNTAKHRGDNTTENVLSPSTVGGMDVDWSYTTGNGVDSSPAVAGGVTYVGSFDDKVYALNAGTGAFLWSFTTGGAVFSSPSVAGGVVYVESLDGKVYALNAGSGALLWYFTTGAQIDSSPAVAGGVVYVGSEDRKVYALNAGSGALLWSYTTGAFVESSPAVAGGVVYVGSDDGKMYALNAGSGALLWTYATGGGIYSSPAVAGGVVYVGSGDDKVYALNAGSGALLWAYATGSSVESAPAVANGVVYVGSDDGKFYALNGGSGALLWTYATGGGIYSSPAVAGGVVYVGSGDDRVYAFNAGYGALLWSYTTGGAVLSSPAVANGVVYAGSADGGVRAFDLAGGTQAPQRPVPARLKPNLQLHAQSSLGEGPGARI